MTMNERLIIGELTYGRPYEQYILHKEWSFPLRFLHWMWPNPQFPADLVTVTEEILNGKLIFCVVIYMKIRIQVFTVFVGRVSTGFIL